MRIGVKSLLGLALLGVGGCAIHDGRAESEPVWWPTPMVRASTFQSSGGNVNLQAAPLDQWLPPLNPDGSLKTP
jgi:hypothetical protein